MSLNSSNQRISSVAVEAQAVNPDALGDTSGTDRLFAAAEYNRQLKDRERHRGSGHVPQSASVCPQSERRAELRQKSLDDWVLRVISGITGLGVLHSFAKRRRVGALA
jgi:hypothetical protein